MEKLTYILTLEATRYFLLPRILSLLQNRIIALILMMESF